MNKLCGLTLFFLFAASPFTAQIPAPLTPAEQRLAAFVDAHSDDALSLLEQSVNIASPTQDLAGVRKVGQLYQKELAAMGFTVRWSDQSMVKRGGHLIAERKGTHGQRILLLGHLDTVLQGEKFVREGSLARGTGSSDMKGGNVVMLQALKALHSIGALDGSNVIVIMTGDEEDTGDPLTSSRKDMIEAAQRSDAALSFEGQAGNTGTVARRGFTGWKLEVGGQTGHSSRIFSENTGDGAIFEVARILHIFRDTFRGEAYLTVNPSIITGGTDVSYQDDKKTGTATGKLNVVAQKVIVEGEFRFISSEQRDSVKARMSEIVAKHLPQTTATITFDDSMPAMAPTPGNYDLLKVYDQSSQALGLGEMTALDPMLRGAGDISFVAPFVSGLDGLGVEGGKAHAPGEFIDLNSLTPQTKRAALLIYRLTR